MANDRHSGDAKRSTPAELFAVRRQLLFRLGAAGMLWGCSSTEAFSSVLPSLDHDLSEAPAQAGDESHGSSYQFWTEDIRSVSLPRTRSIDSADVPHAVFVFYDKQRGFVAGSDIGDAGLPDKADLNVIVHVDHIHLSKTDQVRFAHLQGGSLRIDLQQAQPLPALAERLAWTAIVGVLPDLKGAPDPRAMSFDPGATWGKLQSVPLYGGGGSWTWNFFVQQRKARWLQLLGSMGQGVGVAAPVFGFGLPAIALTALQTVDRLLAELTKESGTDWLFQSSDLFVYGSKAARDSFEGTKLRLKRGTYVIVPSTQLHLLASQASKLEVKDGLIVPMGTSGLDAVEASSQTLPELTYITVGVTTRPSPITSA